MNLSSEDYFRKQKRTFWKKTVAASIVITVVGVTVLTFVFWVKAVIVEVRPEAAALKAQRTLDGLGWVQQNKVYLLASRVNLEIAAQGFISEIVTLERSMPRRHIAISLKEAPAMIKATAIPVDEQVKWHIDKKIIGSGAELQVAVEPGTHTLKASHPYYQPQQSSIRVERGTEKTLSFELKPVQGRLDLFSRPEGVPVSLNGNAIGKTPVSMAQQGGRYSLQIETSDFEPINDTIDITYRQPIVKRNYQLIHKKASVDFKLTPLGGQLSVNGKAFPAMDARLELESLRELIISYSKAGYSSKTIKRMFKPNQKENISLQLKPEFGKVILKTTPASDIKINNEKKGQTPQAFTLKTIPHNIHLSRSGYRSIQKTIHPSRQRVIQINETLMTEEQARLAEAPEVTKNSIGIELVLFKPDKAASFELGAHRSEKGQRANEILRTVKLHRAFYVSRMEISAGHYDQAFGRRTPASDLAVSNVTWSEAALFCNWLSKKEKLPYFYITNGNNITGYNPQSIGYRLLSEAEWEWLARYANRNTPARFVWGNKATIPIGIGNLADESAKNSVATYISGYNDGYLKLAPVGSFKPDKTGLHDLAGNVSEWVHDAYTVDHKAMSNPLGGLNNTSHSGHVVKGSSWKSGTLTELRSAYRQRATGRADDRGFRIARYIY